MVTKLGQPPQGRCKLTALAMIGAITLSIGGGYAGVLLTSGPPEWSRSLQVLLVVATACTVAVGVVSLSLVWLRATLTAPLQAAINVGRREVQLRVGR